MVEHWSEVPGVRGSTPLTSTMYWICIDCKFSDIFGAVFKTERWFEYRCPKCDSKYVMLCTNAFYINHIVIKDKCDDCSRRFNCWTDSW